MSESDHHRSLVKALGGDIVSDSRWNKPPIIYIDLRDGISGEVPPAIGANRPDAFARDLSTGRTIIGEAKTAVDIDNQHTCDQLSSYFLYLQSQAEGELWMAVPWMSAGTALRVSKLMRQQTKAYSIPICVVSYMIGSIVVRRFWRE